MGFFFNCSVLKLTRIISFLSWNKESILVSSSQIPEVVPVNYSYYFFQSGNSGTEKISGSV